MGAQLALSADQHVQNTGEVIQQYAENMTIYYMWYITPIRAPGTRGYTGQLDCPPRFQIAPQDENILVDLLSLDCSESGT